MEREPLATSISALMEIVSMDSGLALRAPRNDDAGREGVTMRFGRC